MDIERLRLAAYRRSRGYDPPWVIENEMGPHPLWLAESLSRVMELRPGMRLLDLGCGKALTSIFFAREFGAQVWAVDLWIDATDNWRRIQEAGVAGAVFPIHADAHALPFGDGFFDAAVSLDAYHYFGTDDLYLGTFAGLVRPGGRLGIVVPGLTAELPGVPEGLRPHWQWELASLHSPAWWRRHWEQTGLVDVEVADLVPDGWAHWLLWAEAVLHRAPDPHRPSFEREVALLRADGGEHLGFTRLVGRRADP